MAGEEPRALEAAPLTGLRFGVLQGLPLQGLDETVTARLQDALGKLGVAGVRLTDETITLLDDMVAVNAKGGLAPPEALAIHRELLKTRGADVDPNVRLRIERASSISAADYVDMAQARAKLTRAMDARLADLDALVMPTTPIVAPKMSELATADAFAPKNVALLRNPALVNFFDLSRHLAAAPGIRAAGRADAGRAQRPRRAALSHRGGGGAAVRELTPKIAQDGEHQLVMLRAEPLDECRLMRGGERLGALERGLTRARQMQGVRAPVVRRGKPLGQAALLEPVQQADEARPFDAERVGQISL